jgi:ribonucleotide reductase alpha subunit
LGFFSKLFSSKNKSTPEVEERTVLNIRIGDIVTFDLVDYEVVGKITYRDGSYEWFAYQLLEGSSTKWLAAEMDDELELGVYETVKLPVGEPFPKELKYEGKTYYKDEQGEARVTGEGRSKNINGRTTRYADYISEDEETYLSLESWGSEVEVSYGYDIEPYEIKIIAGSK